MSFALDNDDEVMEVATGDDLPAKTGPRFLEVAEVNALRSAVHLLRTRAKGAANALEFIPSALHAAIRAGTNGTDLTAYLQAWLDSGAEEVVLPGPGVYDVTGLTVGVGSVVARIRAVGRPTIRLATGANRVALSISKPQFVDVDGAIRLVSTGTKGDGNNTVGIKLAASSSYMKLRSPHVEKFSGHGIEVVQGVHIGIESPEVVDCRYGITLSKNAGVPTTTVTIDRPYISSCTRGLFGDGATGLTLVSPIFEYSGSSDTEDGALHLTGGAEILLLRPHFEANHRNYVCVDARMTFVKRYELAGTAPDIVTYVGTAFPDRGSTYIDNHRIETANLGPDTTSQRDLVIGENLTVPLAGGSVQFGRTTTETLSGTVESDVWTTIKEFTALEMSGPGNEQAGFLYAVYGGQGDKTTGFDMGTVLGGVARSFTGALPAWLQMSGTDLQIKLTNDSYGLNWKLALTKIHPGP